MSRSSEYSHGMPVMLVNAEGCYALWPPFAQIPSGWTVVHETDHRRASFALQQAF